MDFVDARAAMSQPRNSSLTERERDFQKSQNFGPLRDISVKPENSQAQLVCLAPCRSVIRARRHSVPARLDSRAYVHGLRRRRSQLRWLLRFRKPCGRQRSETAARRCKPLRWPSEKPMDVSTVGGNAVTDHGHSCYREPARLNSPARANLAKRFPFAMGTRKG